MPTNLRRIGSFPLLLLLTMLLACAAPANAQYVTEIGQTAVQGELTGVGYVNVVIYPTFSGPQGYLNVLSDLDPGSSADDPWLVKNFPFPMQELPGFFGPRSPVLFSVPFDLMGLSPSGGFNVFASFTPDPMLAPKASQMILNASRTFSLYDSEYLATCGDGVACGGGGKVPLSLTSLPELSATAAAAKPGHSAVQTSNPDDGVPGVRDDIPGLKQQPNECAPTAVAQSLLWLVAKGQLTLPPQFQEDQNHKGTRALINTLKAFMSWNDGVKPENFTPAKEAFVKKYSLPLTVEQGGKDNGDGTFDFIKAQIAKGQDVELWMKFQGGNMHVVTVAGTHEDKDKKFIYIKDPISPGEANDAYELTGKGSNAYKEVKGYKYNSATGTTKIMFAVAESPKTK